MKYIWIPLIFGALVALGLWKSEGHDVGAAIPCIAGGFSTVIAALFMYMRQAR